MANKSALFLGLVLFSGLDAATSCDANALTQCNSDYIAAVPGTSGDETCRVIDTMLDCMNTACAGCPAAVRQQFNAIVSPIKSSSCTSTCQNSTICTAPEPLTCGSGSAASGSGRLSVSLVALVLWFAVLLSSFDVAVSCDASAMTQCNSDYIAAVPGATGDETCRVIDTMLDCMNTACAGCPAAVRQQFNAIVSPIKSSSCTSTCQNSTICTAAEPLTCGSGAGSSGTATSGSGRLSASLVALAICFAVLVQK